MPLRISGNRRRFLATSLATGFLATQTSRLLAAPTFVPNRFALLADTHIPASAEIEARDTNMTTNLKNVVGQLTAEESPFTTLILGDCAYLEGQPADYQLLAETTRPLRDSGHQLLLALGNHDHRNHCAAQFRAPEQAAEVKLERRVTVLPGQFANWFLLDTLDKVNLTPGLLGEEQLQWLAAALDRHADMPALIGMHHNPSAYPDLSGNVRGLVDAKAFLQVIEKRPHVSAVFFGHTHVWSIVEHEKIQLVNLPPVAYIFAEGHPNGWVDCHVSREGWSLKVHCHDTKHAVHGTLKEFAWRA